MKELRIGHKNEGLIFGKTNPIRADEGSVKTTSIQYPNDPQPWSISKKRDPAAFGRLLGLDRDKA